MHGSKNRIPDPSPKKEKRQVGGSTDQGSFINFRERVSASV